MERSGVALVTFMYVLISRISAAEVEMKVRPGDNVTLYSDCVWKTGFNTVWFRNCSHENQPPLIMPVGDSRINAHLLRTSLPRYSFLWNSSSSSYELLVENVSEADLGLYYCALCEKIITEDKTGGGVQKYVYHYGKRTTRLCLLEATPSTPPVSDCSVCWKLLVSVCPVCVLLFSTCVYCIYRNRDKVGKMHDPAERSCENTKNPTSRKPDKVGGDGVCYASLDLPNRRQRHLKKKKKSRVESSEFSSYSEITYSEVKSGHM